jgi:hypothetical protein
VVKATVSTAYADQPIAPAGVKQLQDLLDFQLKTGVARKNFAIADWVAR